MHNQRKCKEWLAPLPEEEYLRIIYVGKLQITPEIGDGIEVGISAAKLEDMIRDI